MARLTKPEPTQTDPGYRAPRTPEAARQAIADMLTSAGLDKTLSDFFAVCAPCRPFEQYTAGRFEYASRLQQSASAWIRMTDRERMTLIAGAEDGVRWRGEDLRQYRDVWNETMRLHEIGLSAYMAQAQGKLETVRGSE